MIATADIYVDVIYVSFISLALLCVWGMVTLWKILRDAWRETKVLPTPEPVRDDWVWPDANVGTSGEDDPT